MHVFSEDVLSKQPKYSRGLHHTLKNRSRITWQKKQCNQEFSDQQSEDANKINVMDCKPGIRISGAKEND
jgi:hypothetical protein